MDMNHTDIVQRLSMKPPCVPDSATLVEAAQEIQRLRDRVKMLEERIGDVSITLYDWDGYYDPDTKQGEAEELANLIEEAYETLQGKSWRSA